MTLSDNSLWQLSNNTDYNGYSFASAPASSLRECVQRCNDYNATTDICGVAVWFASFTDQQCYLRPSSVLTNPGPNQLPSDIEAYSAVKVNGTSCVPKIEPQCPSGNNTFYTTTNGNNYRALCGVAYSQGTISCPVATNNSWSACMNRCDATNGCEAAALIRTVPRTFCCLYNSTRIPVANQGAIAGEPANARSKRSLPLLNGISGIDNQLTPRATDDSQNATTNSTLTAITISMGTTLTTTVLYAVMDNPTQMDVVANPLTLPDAGRFVVQNKLITGPYGGGPLLYVPSKGSQASKYARITTITQDSASGPQIPLHSRLFYFTNTATATGPALLGLDTLGQIWQPYMCTYSSGSDTEFLFFLASTDAGYPMADDLNKDMEFTTGISPGVPVKMCAPAVLQATDLSGLE